MDYKEKYEEALERAKKAVKEGMVSQSFVDEIFGVQESEDERIRKKILALVKKHAVNHERCQMEAYLEKQKEQKTLILDGEIEDRKRDIVTAIRKCYLSDYAEYLTSFLKGLSPEDNSEDEYGQEMLGIAYKLMYEHIPENLRTQEFWDSLKFMREYTGKVAIIHSYEKPTEWNDTDMKEARDNLISVCRDWEFGKQTTLLPIVAVRARYFLEHLTEPKPTEWSKDFEDNIRNLLHDKLTGHSEDGSMSWTTLIDDKTLKDIVNGIWFYVGKEALKYPNKELSQPEWSEEDEKMLTGIIERGSAQIPPHEPALREEQMEWLMNRFKSLHPQPHWKPGEEQMEALMLAIEGKWEAIMPTGYMSRRLEDLYEGLANTFKVECKLEK